MRDAVKALVVVVGLSTLALGGAYAGNALGTRDARSVAASTPEVVTQPVERTVDLPVAVTVAPVPPPTPSYTYTWDPNNPYQCFNPSDPQLPANAPRCPARAVASDPGKPTIVCPPGTTLVFPDNQPACLPAKPSR